MSRIIIKPKIPAGSMAERLMLRWGTPAVDEGKASRGPSRSELISHFRESEGKFEHPDFPAGFSPEQLDEAVLATCAACLLLYHPEKKLSIGGEKQDLAKRISERGDFKSSVLSGEYRKMLKVVLEELLLLSAAALPSVNEDGSGSDPAPEQALNPEVQVLPSVYVEKSMLEGKSLLEEREAAEVDRTTTRKLARYVSLAGPPAFVTQFAGLTLHENMERAALEASGIALREYAALMENLVRGNPDAFTPLYTLNMAPARIMICPPLDVGRYDTVPLFIQKRDQLPRLVFGYRSKSQDSWRRFAGMVSGIYWKGDSEHFQNFDWRIQKAVDQIFDSHPKRAMPEGFRDLGLLSIDDPYLVISLERKIQDSMTGWIGPLDITASGNNPHYLVDHWWSGRHDDGYDRHLNIVARSLNGRYLYALAVTGDGMVPKFIQLEGEDSLNELGAPRFSVPLKKEDQWILTPVVEYASQQERAWEVTGEHLVVEGTIVFGGNRVRIKGLHQSSKSPFFELDNGLSDFYRLIRTGSYDAIETLLCGIKRAGGALPSSADREDTIAPEQGTMEWRYSHLSHAFSLYYWGQLDPWSEPGQALMASYMINNRDIAVFRRYAEYVRSNLLPNGDLHEAAKRQVAEKLWNMSRQWAGDMKARTVKIEM